MAELSTLARPYAEAVFRIAREAGDLNGWASRLQLLAQIVADASMSVYLADPLTGSAQAAAAFDAVAGEALGATGSNLVKVLADNRRLPLLPEISAQYLALKDDIEGVLEADIVSAFPLDQPQIDDLAAALKVHFGRDVHVHVSVDAGLIGGVIVRVGDRIIDGSVKGRLEQMVFSLRG